MFKLNRHKRFDYTPLYYKPTEDPAEKRRKRLHFRRREAPRGLSLRHILLFILALAIVYVLKKLASL